MSLIKATTVAALVAFASLDAVSHANAAALSISGGTLTIWSGDNSTQRNSADPAQQALPSATPYLTQVASGSFSGALNYTGATTDTIGGFLSSDSSPIAYGACASNSSCYSTILSEGSYIHSTLFEFDFTAAYDQIVATGHNDGLSLFAGTDTTDLVPLSSSAPTASGNDTVALTDGTTCRLYYSEMNGLPANLTTGGSEPISLALLGIGMIGTGVAVRRLSKTATR